MDYSDLENVRYVREKAMQALAEYEHRNRRAVPACLRSFYEGDFVDYHLRYCGGTLPRRGSASYQLALTAPTWINKARLRRGDLQKHVLPIFVTEQSLYVVVDTRGASCPVGWIMEEPDGEAVVPAGMELRSFLAGLCPDPPGRKSRCSTPASLDQYEEWDVEFSPARFRT